MKVKATLDVRIREPHPILLVPETGRVLVTPEWISVIMEDHSGGWFHPVQLADGHPALLEFWECLYCQATLRAGDVIAVMPHHALDSSYWTAVHRTCFIDTLGETSSFEDPERIAYREISNGTESEPSEG